MTRTIPIVVSMKRASSASRMFFPTERRLAEPSHRVTGAGWTAAAAIGAQLLSEQPACGGGCTVPANCRFDLVVTMIVYTAGCRTADTAGRSRLLRPSVEGCETGAVSRSSLARERWRE